MARTLTKFARASLDPDVAHEPQITSWRRKSELAPHDYFSESVAAMTAPDVYTPPQLRPSPDNVELSQAHETETLIALQSWEGVVIGVDEASFLVRLIDVSGDHADEEAELSKGELSEFDLDLLEPGAIFYWTIGYRQQLPRGGRERVSRIRFRRVPAWTEAQLAAARESAATLARDLDW
jgi:hypothetical protein